MKKAQYLSIEEKLALLRRIEAGERLAAVADETVVLRKSRASHGNRSIGHILAERQFEFRG